MPKRSNAIPNAPAARILMNAGAKRVSAEAVEAFVSVLTDRGEELAKRAADVARHAGRKTIHDADIRIAHK